nr:hypothetical protein Iba_chr06bCG3820 [Ipomoea batatas]
MVIQKCHPTAFQMQQQQPPLEIPSAYARRFSDASPCNSAKWSTIEIASSFSCSNSKFLKLESTVKSSGADSFCSKLELTATSPEGSSISLQTDSTIVLSPRFSSFSLFGPKGNSLGGSIEDSIVELVPTLSSILEFCPQSSRLGIFCSLLESIDTAGITWRGSAEYSTVELVASLPEGNIICSVLEFSLQSLNSGLFCS